MSYNVAAITTIYEPQIVLLAALLTAGSVTGLTVYAFTTKTDFTILRGILASFISVLFLGMLLGFFFYSIILPLSLGALLFSVYIVVDT